MPGPRPNPFGGLLGVLARGGVALVAVLAALLLAELVVRAVGRVPQVKPIHVSDERFVYRRSENPILSFELRPNYRNDAPDLFQTYERTNAHGQRDRERALDKPEGLRRILLVGDSVVEGSGVREAETISRQLEALYPDGDTEVLNLGVSGYCTRAEVELLETRGLAFDPDAVVLLFVENDFHNFNAEAFALAPRVHRPAWTERLFLRSEAFRLAALELNLFQFGADQDPMGFNSQAIGANNVVEGLRRLRSLTESGGFRTLVAIWPRFENDGIVDLPFMPRSANESADPRRPGELVIERLAAMVGLPSVRLSTHFEGVVQAAAAAGRRLNPRIEFTIGDRMHPSPRGCRVAAAGLRAALDAPEFAKVPAGRGLPAGADDPLAVEAARALGSGVKPDYARVFTRLGNLEQAAGRYAAAIEHYKQALGEDPSAEEAHVNLGHALRAAGQLDAAVTHYEAALYANPDISGVRVELGLALEQLGRLGAARALYEAQLARSPEDPQAHLRLGNFWIKQGRPAEAVPHYERSLRVAPEVAETHNNLGLAYELLGDLDRAARYYEDALERDSGLVDTHNNLGIVRARQGNDGAAARALGQAVNLDPGRHEARLNLALVLERLGRPAEAERQYREGLRLAQERGDTETALRFETELRRVAPKRD